MRLRLFPQLVTTDDRGRRFPMHILSSGDPALRDPRVQAARRRIDGCFRAEGTIVGFLSALCIALGMPIVRDMLDLPESFAGSAIAAVCCFPFVWLLNLVAHRRTRRMIPAASHILVNDGLCGVCGYNLHGLVPDPDRCIPCPECGAAWNHARIQRTAPLDERPASAAQQFGLGKEELCWRRRLRIDQRYGVDDRGLPIALASVDALRNVHARTSDHAARAADAASAILKATKPRRYRWLAGCAVIGMLLVVAAVIGPALTRPALLLFAVIALLACYLLIRTDLIVRPATIIAAAKNAGICPACARDLRGLAAATDGLVECPGCGAAWRLAPSQFQPLERATFDLAAAPVPSS